MCVCLPVVLFVFSSEAPEEEYDPRSLFERLQEQKDKKQEEYEEQFKFSKAVYLCCSFHLDHYLCLSPLFKFTPSYCLSTIIKEPVVAF